MWVLLRLAACGSGDDGSSCTDGACAETSSPTGDTGGTTPPTTGETGVTTGACAPDPGLSVVSVTATEGNIHTQQAITVTLSAPAAVAVRCTKTDDPVEVHLLEDTEPSASHTLRFSGFLADSTYTCLAAPTCPTLTGAPASLTVTTGTRPRTIPDAAVHIDRALGMTGAFTMMNFQDGACDRSDSPWEVAYDPEGRLRWWKQFPVGITGDIEALWHPEDDAVVWGGGYSPEGRAHVSPMWGPDTYASENLPYALETYFHHDAKRLADGRILTLEARQNTNGAMTWDGWDVRLHDPASGRVDVDLDSQRYVDDGWLPVATDSNHNGFLDGEELEPYHANAVEYYLAPSGGQDRLYVSMCFDQSILALDPVTGEVRWKLKEHTGWTVYDSNGYRLPENMLPECQHGMDVLGDDHLILYDNGQNRHQSQISDLTIDGVNKRVTLNWHWSDGWFEDTLGDADDLGNGRVLVDRAHPECWSLSPGRHTDVLELDRATGHIASSLTLPDVAHSSYRAQRYDGCEFLPGTHYCAATMARAAELAPLFDR